MQTGNSLPLQTPDKTLSINKPIVFNRTPIDATAKTPTDPPEYSAPTPLRGWVAVGKGVNLEDGSGGGKASYEMCAVQHLARPVREPLGEEIKDFDDHDSDHESYQRVTHTRPCNKSFNGHGSRGNYRNRENTRGNKKQRLITDSSDSAGDASSVSSSASKQSAQAKPEKPWTQRIPNPCGDITRFEIKNSWSWSRIYHTALRSLPFVGVGLGLCSAVALSPKWGGLALASSIGITSLISGANQCLEAPIDIQEYLCGDFLDVVCERQTASRGLTCPSDVRNAVFSTVPVVKAVLNMDEWTCVGSKINVVLQVCEDVVSDLLTRYKSSEDLKKNGYQVAARMVQLNLHASTLPRVIHDSYFLAYLWRRSTEQADAVKFGRWLN